jgi:hypothetical protein
MSKENKNGNFAKPMLADVFLSELSELMKKHNATLELERIYDNEYETHAELDFMVNGVFVGNFYASPIKSLNADDIRRLSENVC